MGEQNGNGVSEDVTGAEALQLISQREAWDAPLKLPEEQALCDGLPSGDYGNGQRLAREHGHRIRWVEEWGWLYWDGTMWVIDHTRELQRMASDTVSKMVKFAIDMWNGKGEGKTLIAAALQASSRSGINNMVDMAAAASHGTYRVAVRPDLFDQDDHIFNAENGIIDLKTGALNRHDPDYFIAKKGLINFKPSVECPNWVKFLEEVQPVKEVRDFLQVLAGYCLTGDNRERKHFLHWGKGRNGKSTFFRAMEGIMGLGDQNYAATVDPATFSEDAQGKVRSDLARLAGKRLVTTTEVRGGTQFDEQLMKRITGGEQLIAAFKHKNEFPYFPKFKIHVVANEKPNVREQTDGVWDRIVLIPWTMTITAPDPKFYESKLEPELPGIFAWAVQGAVQFYQNGLQLPSGIKDAITAYREEMDVLAPWIAACCFLDPRAKESNKDLIESYEQFCTQNGLEPLKQRAFSLRLAQKDGIVKGRTVDNNIGWKGIALKRSENVELWNPLMDKIEHYSGG